MIIQKSKMNRILIFLFCIQILFDINIFSQTEFIKGADVSYLQEIENNGGKFYDNRGAEDPLIIMKNHGINYIRLRLWNNPPEKYCSLDSTLVIAARVKKNGLKLLLDLHYSDTWAGPGRQTKPFAWQNISFDVLKDSIYSFTYNVIKTLKERFVMPDIVQVGNEIRGGMLWDDGRVNTSFDIKSKWNKLGFNTNTQWNKLSELLITAIKAVNDAAGSEDSIKSMIHIDCGGNMDISQSFFKNLINRNVKFDIIGLSYYPWHHGELVDLKNNMDNLANLFHKPIIIAETGYAWTLSNADTARNRIRDTSRLLTEYPPTVTGQYNFLHDLILTIKNANGGLGYGVFYWEPEAITTIKKGSRRDNLTLFDFDGKVLNSINAFK